MQPPHQPLKHDAPGDGEILRAGPLEIYFDQRTVLTDGRPMALTVREFGLLEALARRRDRIVSRSDLFGEVWGRDPENGDRSVDVYISKLRGKLERALPHWSYIQTHIGFGYCFSPEPVSGDE